MCKAFLKGTYYITKGLSKGIPKAMFNMRLSHLLVLPQNVLVVIPFKAVKGPTVTTPFPLDKIETVMNMRLSHVLNHPRCLFSL